MSDFFYAVIDTEVQNKYTAPNFGRSLHFCDLLAVVVVPQTHIAQVRPDQWEFSNLWTYVRAYIRTLKPPAKSQALLRER